MRIMRGMLLVLVVSMTCLIIAGDYAVSRETSGDASGDASGDTSADATDSEHLASSALYYESEGKGGVVASVEVATGTNGPRQWSQTIAPDATETLVNVGQDCIGPGLIDNQVLCGNGDIMDHFAVCGAMRSFRIACPPNQPYLCARKNDCGDGEDRCCQETVLGCDDKNGIGECSAAVAVGYVSIGLGQCSTASGHPPTHFRSSESLAYTTCQSVCSDDAGCAGFAHSHLENGGHCLIYSKSRPTVVLNPSATNHPKSGPGAPETSHRPSGSEHPKSEPGAFIRGKFPLMIQAPQDQISGAQNHWDVVKWTGPLYESSSDRKITSSDGNLVDGFSCYDRSNGDCTQPALATHAVAKGSCRATMSIGGSCNQVPRPGYSCTPFVCTPGGSGVAVRHNHTIAQSHNRKSGLTGGKCVPDAVLSPPTAPSPQTQPPTAPTSAPWGHVYQVYQGTSKSTKSTSSPHGGATTPPTRFHMPARLIPAATRWCPDDHDDDSTQSCIVSCECPRIIVDGFKYSKMIRYDSSMTTTTTARRTARSTGAPADGFKVPSARKLCYSCKKDRHKCTDTVDAIISNNFPAEFRDCAEVKAKGGCTGRAPVKSTDVHWADQRYASLPGLCCATCAAKGLGPSPLVSGCMDHEPGCITLLPTLEPDDIDATYVRPGWEPATGWEQVHNSEIARGLTKATSDFTNGDHESLPQKSAVNETEYCAELPLTCKTVTAVRAWAFTPKGAHKEKVANAVFAALLANKQNPRFRARQDENYNPPEWRGGLYTWSDLSNSWNTTCPGTPYMGSSKTGTYLCQTGLTGFIDDIMAYMDQRNRLQCCGGAKPSRSNTCVDMPDADILATSQGELTSCVQLRNKGFCSEASNRVACCLSCVAHAISRKTVTVDLPPFVRGGVFPSRGDAMPDIADAIPAPPGDSSPSPIRDLVGRLLPSGFLKNDSIQTLLVQLSNRSQADRITDGESRMMDAWVTHEPAQRQPSPATTRRPTYHRDPFSNKIQTSLFDLQFFNESQVHQNTTESEIELTIAELKNTSAGVRELFKRIKGHLCIDPYEIVSNQFTLDECLEACVQKGCTYLSRPLIRSTEAGHCWMTSTGGPAHACATKVYRYNGPTTGLSSAWKNVYDSFVG